MSTAHIIQAALITVLTPSTGWCFYEYIRLALHPTPEQQQHEGN